MKTTGLGFLLAVWCVAASGCESTPGVSAFLSDGEPDLIPLPQAGFCRAGTVVITLRNQGPSDAEASTTTVAFAGGGSTELSTPSVEGGRIASLAAVPIPAQCFAPDCFLQVIVDANDDIDESDENNNTAEVTCPAP